ncbi:MAG: hypothetical protein H7287_05965 [Thermoleophilia bacterium]|nr:hypothetical protein [Thermoleophilia bacterium]
MATPSTLPNGAAGTVSGGGASADGTGGIDAATLGSMLAMVTTLIGILSAQHGANAAPPVGGSVIGGGAVATGGGGIGIAPTETITPIGGDVSATTSSSIMGTSSVGGGSSWSTNGWEIVAPIATGGGATVGTSSSSIIGGGSIGARGQQAVNTALAATGVSTMSGAATVGGGASTNGWEVITPTVGPQVTTPAAATAGSPAVEADAPVGTQVDMRRVAGAPAAGGVIQAILSTVSVPSMPAMTEGTWLTLTDEAGAQMQVHGHGKWATATNAQILAGIQSRQIGVHLHADGTVHLHDPM